jgi:hypothetical protein
MRRQPLAAAGYAAAVAAVVGLRAAHRRHFLGIDAPHELTEVAEVNWQLGILECR